MANDHPQFLAFFSCFFALVSTSAQARYACSLVFQTQVSEVAKYVREDGYYQWLYWEQNANVEQFRKPSAPIQFQISRVPKDKVDFEVDPAAPTSLRAFIERQNSITWLRHPWNPS
ncbi:MAG: hypothetical protein N2578_06235, partial [Bdellovibrionaceae bacterium]|nr:hypothetical protein [Pseudobdellovibrionaceae bacterium]